jgi:hypothetical protein
MDVNTPVWGYYQSKFVDPLFVPYLRYPVRDNDGNIVKINTWSEGAGPGLVNPALIRKNWGQDFQLIYPEDPTPTGWVKGKDGWAVFVKPEYEPIFYTDKAYTNKRQFPEGYTDMSYKPRRISDQFDMRSVNPITGKYTVYFEPKISDPSSRYGKNPTRDSYLA